ncbi:MAG: hypothetical protein A3B41_02960 [Candidatus Levybacteria bacterium RIFCSPLOWO2_01_FULL_37_26]|nr:MAG: hypothetical protein A3E40_00560 [Candidatus Levybacteria bacterium RIFCSPHIGHO2_12_FULL_37_9]OGH40676.1 MAG: hypothetical protein A3B41_02960 [Candidatus Levybacteria bacterium RIFCSPLOWO2_01_FULL_37_26]
MAVPVLFLINFCVFSSFYRQLIPTYNLGFATLQAIPDLQSQISGTSGKSPSVNVYEKIRTSLILKR